VEVRLIRKEKEYRLTRDGEKLVFCSDEREQIYDICTLRGVSVQGFCAGDWLTIYKEDGEQRYELAEDCAPEAMDALFEGVKRLKAKKVQSNRAVPRRPDWRAEMQEPEQLKRMLRIGRVIQAVALIGSLGSFFTAIPAFILMCMAAITASLWCCLRYPQYFSIMDSREYIRAGYTSKAMCMNDGLALSAVVLMFRTMFDFYFTEWRALITIGVIAGAAGCALLFAALKDVRQNPKLLIGIFLTAALAAAGISGQINHLCNFAAEPPKIYVVEKMESHRSRKSPRKYYCEVQTEQGERLRLRVSYDEYSSTEQGDSVLVYIGEGALGIEYAYFVENLSGQYR